MRRELGTLREEEDKKGKELQSRTSMVDQLREEIDKSKKEADQLREEMATWRNKLNVSEVRGRAGLPSDNWNSYRGVWNTPPPQKKKTTKTTTTKQKQMTTTKTRCLPIAQDWTNGEWTIITQLNISGYSVKVTTGGTYYFLGYLVKGGHHRSSSGGRNNGEKAKCEHEVPFFKPFTW